MVHSFHDDYCMAWDQFEEGFAEAVCVEVQTRIYDDEPELYEQWHLHTSPPYYPYHQNQNMPGIASHYNDFSRRTAGGPTLTDYRYRAAGFAWWKAWFEDNEFFGEFNKRLKGCSDPQEFADFDVLHQFAVDSFSGDGLEGIPFHNWLHFQPILNLNYDPVALFFTLLGTEYAACAYGRDWNPPHEDPLVNVGILFEEHIDGGPPARSWTQYTDSEGWVYGLINDAPYDWEERRLILTATVLADPRPSANAASWVCRPLPLEPELEIYGCTTGVNSGWANLINYEFGFGTYVPIHNKAFHFPMIEYPGIRYLPGGGASKYKIEIYNDANDLVASRFFVKDGGDYFIAVNDAGIAEKSSIPSPNLPAFVKAFGVAQNAPNPCSTATSIVLSLGSPSSVEVSVYDLSGRRVATPFKGALPAGENRVAVDTSALPTGVYIYRVIAGANVATKKMVVAK